MIDYKKELVSKLKSLGLEVYNENFLTSDVKVPCISYQEANNVAAETGDTLGYSEIYMNVKIWGRDAQTLAKYSLMIDELMRKAGFSRIGTSELWLNGIGQNQLRYMAIGKEIFN